MDYEQRTLKRKEPPHAKEHYSMDDTYRLRSYLFNTLVLKNSGSHDLQPNNSCVLRNLGAEVLLLDHVRQGTESHVARASPSRLESCGPKNLFRSPVQEGIRWSYLNYYKRSHEGKSFMVCVPLSNFESNVIGAFRHHYLEDGEPDYFQSQLPKSAETYRGIHVYSIKNVQQLQMSFDGTPEYDMLDYTWVFGAVQIRGLDEEQSLVGSIGVSGRCSRGVWRALRVAIP